MIIVPLRTRKIARSADSSALDRRRDRYGNHAVVDVTRKAHALHAAPSVRRSTGGAIIKFQYISRNYTKLL